MISRALLLVGLLLASLPAFASGVMVYFTAPTQTTFGPPASFTVSVQADAWDGYEYVSSLKLYRNGTLIASKSGYEPGTIGVSAANSNLPTGTYTFRATATTNHGVSISQSLTVTVNTPPAVQLGSTTGSPYIAPATLGLSATASDNDGSVARVEFYANGSHVGTDTSAPYQANWGSVPAGTHSITARAYDNLGGSTLSAAQSVTVTPSRVIGNIDSAGIDAAGVARVNGWACSTGLNQSIEVHVYAGGAYGTGTHVVTATANLASESAVASACQAVGTAYRFSVLLDNTLRHHHGGKAIHIHGISPVGQPNNVISNSGTYAVPLLNRNATYTGQSMPTTLLPGQSFAATVQMRNDGDGVWYGAENYRLGSTGGSAWGVTRAYLGADVGKGGTATFSIAGKAPTTPGTYSFQWRMLQENMAWFGQYSPNTAIRVVSGTVSASPNPCGFPEGGSTCTATIAWTSNASDAEVWVSTSGDIKDASLFARGQNGTQDASGITGSGATFFLMAAGVQMHSARVWGEVNPPPLVELTAPTAGASAAPPGSFLLKANASDPDGIASVSFYANGALLKTVPSPPYEFNWSGVASGQYLIHATALDNRGREAPTAQVGVLVNAAPTVQLTAPSPGNNGIAPATVAVSASAADAENRIASVSFYAGSALLDIDESAPFSITWSGAAAGNYELTAVVRDIHGATGTSAPVAITIVAPVANPSSSTRYYLYDRHQRLCKVVEPETRATVMEYDAAGNLAWSAAGLELLSTTGSATQCDADRTDAGASGRVARRTYNVRNRLETLRFPDGRGDQDWTYTATGLPKTITTSNDGPAQALVANTYEYNRRGLLTGESSGQPNWYSWGLGYGYDRNGHLASQSYPADVTVNYAPNALGQPTQAVAGFGILASGVQYHPNGSIKQFTYGNGIVHTMQQNARQFPAEVSSSGGALNFSYRYDGNGNVARIWDHARDTGDGYYGRWMEYDTLDRLTSVGSCSFGGGCWHRFSYDKLDNLTSWKLDGVKDYAEYYYEPGTHRLISLRNSLGSAVAGFGYDVQGNLSNKNGQGYQFDFGNRLRAVNDHEAYRYDGHGRRVLAWQPNAGSILSMYSHGGQLLFDENYRKPGTEAKEYIYLAGSVIATRERNYSAGTQVVTYHHTDALGSPVAVTNASGAVIERTQYEPYGAIVGGAKKQGLGYTGHVMDAATGLTYMQQRYYDPTVGRFLSVDPVTASTVNGGNFNRYWYGNNNPYRFVDPDGRLSRDCLGGLCDRYKKAGRQCEMTCIGRGEARATTRGERIKNTAKGYIDDQAALGRGGQKTAHFFGDDFIDAAGAWADGKIKEGVKSAAFGLLLRKLSVLRGANVDDVVAAIPEGWERSVSNNGKGIRFHNPERQGEAVRIQFGDPDHHTPVKQGNYFRISEDGRKTDPIPLEGNPTL